MDSVTLLKDLTLLPGISGHEKAISKYMLNYFQDKVPFKKDRLGSVSFEFKGENKEPKILVVGHMDEIGFIVQNVTDSGLIKLQNIGGWDMRTLLSCPLEIINHAGKKIPGIIGSIPIHFLKGSGNGDLDLDKMFVDIGASSDTEVYEEFEIRLGDPVLPICNYYYQEEKELMFSKAFDDRVGVAVALELGDFLMTNKHPNTVYCAGSVQEEVGTRGAQTIANLVNPDIAIVIEGAPADDFPGNKANAQAVMNQGVQIRLYDPTIVVNQGLRDFILDLAKKNYIPHQIAVRKSGGTDAGKIHLSNIGVPSIVLSVPVRYAHSHNGIISMKDYRAVLDLVKAITLELDNKVLDKILN